LIDGGRDRRGRFGSASAAGTEGVKKSVASGYEDLAVRFGGRGGDVATGLVLVKRSAAGKPENVERSEEVAERDDFGAARPDDGR
jgi:hypothetical protein